MMLDSTTSCVCVCVCVFCHCAPSLSDSGLVMPRPRAPPCHHKHSCHTIPLPTTASDCAPLGWLDLGWFGLVFTTPLPGYAFTS